VKFLILAGTVLLVWGIAAGTACLVDSASNWLPSGLAALICTLPALGTMALAKYTEGRGPVAALGTVLVAPILRLVFALLIGFALGITVPALKADPARFVFWGLGFYLLTLVVETILILPRAPLSSEAKTNATAGPT
jgi:hypothetical protein